MVSFLLTQNQILPNFRRVWNKQQKNLPFQNWEYQAGSQFLSVLEGNSELLQQPLMTILNIIMFEVQNISFLEFLIKIFIKDCKNQWSMSRPLLGLILINHDSFGKVQENLCSQQPQEKQAQLSKVRWRSFYVSGVHYSDTRGRTTDVRVLSPGQIKLIPSK